MNKQRIPSVKSLENKEKNTICWMIDMYFDWMIDVDTLNNMTQIKERINYMLECNTEAKKINKERSFKDKLLWTNKTNWLEVAHEEANVINESKNRKETIEFENQIGGVRVRVLKASYHSDNYYITFFYNNQQKDINFMKWDTLEFHYKNGIVVDMTINDLLKLGDEKLDLSKVVNLITFKVFPQTDHIPLDAYIG